MRSIIVFLLIVSGLGAYFFLSLGKQQVAAPVAEKALATPSQPQAFPEKSLWPEEISLLAPAKFSMQGQYGNVDTTFPAGTHAKISKVSAPDTVTVTVGGLAATVPISSTDFVARSAKTTGQAPPEMKGVSAPAPVKKTAPMHESADNSTWVEISFQVQQVLENGWLLAYRKSLISSSGGDTAWREMMPREYQDFIITGHPKASTASDGDVLSGKLVLDGQAKSESGRTARRYRYISE